MKIPKSFSFTRQVNNFQHRGMQIDGKNKKRLISEMRNFGYYKFKTYSYPFSNWHSYWKNYIKYVNSYNHDKKTKSNSYENQANKKFAIGNYKCGKEYEKLARDIQKGNDPKLIKWNKQLQKNFHLKYDSRLHSSEIELRYIQDKILRVNVMSIIESLEVSLNSNIADVLGQKGPFYYMDFCKWVNKDISYEELFYQQAYLRRTILNKLTKHRNRQLKDLYLNNNFKSSIYDQTHKFPSVWLMVNLITFGTTVHLMSIMDDSMKYKIAERYNYHRKKISYWIEWMKDLNVVRNICAHNDDLLDLILTSPPMIPRAFKRYICTNTSIAAILCLLKFLTINISSEHINRNFINIAKTLHLIIYKSHFNTNKIVKMMGFRYYESIDDLLYKIKRL